MDTFFMWRLRDALEKKGITRTELSRLSGVAKGDITHYLKGDYTPKQDKCYLLAKALGVDPGWLMTGVEQVAEEPRPIFTPDSDKWRLIITNMTIEDYEMVRDAFNRTERRLREEGKM